MRKILALPVLLALSAFVLKSQSTYQWYYPLPQQTHIVMHQQCHSSGCAFQTWRANTPGGMLVAVIRVLAKSVPPCEAMGHCGSAIFSVGDADENLWHRAYTDSWSGAVYYALDVKASRSGDVINVGASYGYNVGGENSVAPYQPGSTATDWLYDVIILEYPPSYGPDGAPSWAQYQQGGGDDEPHAPAITVTGPNDLLIFWSDNWWLAGPLHLTVQPDFVTEDNDGYLAVSDRMAGPGTYSASGHYDGYCLWHAGLVAFKMK